jgi:hypothetical protein
MSTNLPATRAEELSEHASHETRSLTTDVATAPTGPGAVAGINETPHPITHDGLRGWAARWPVISFLVLLFTLAYPVMSLPVLAAHGVIPDGGCRGYRVWTPSASPRRCWSSWPSCPQHSW